MGWQSKFQPVTLITSPYEKLKISKPWANKSTAFILDERFITGESISGDSLRLATANFETYQLLKDHTKRYQKFKSAWMLELYVTTSLQSFLKKIYGPRFIFDLKEYQYNKSPRIGGKPRRN